MGLSKRDQAVLIIENSLALPYITYIQIIQINFIHFLIITFTRGFGVLGYCQVVKDVGPVSF